MIYIVSRWNWRQDAFSFLFEVSKKKIPVCGAFIECFLGRLSRNFPDCWELLWKSLVRMLLVAWKDTTERAKSGSGKSRQRLQDEQRWRPDWTTHVFLFFVHLEYQVVTTFGIQCDRQSFRIFHIIHIISFISVLWYHHEAQYSQMVGISIVRRLRIWAL